MAYTIELDFGLGWVDYSSSLYGRNPIRRQRAIYNDLKPVISTVKFQLVKSADLVNQLLLSSEDIPIRILSGGAAYFYGYVRPTIKATVKSSVGLEALDIEAVDLWYKLDRAVGTTRVISGWAISNPSSKSVSILHQLFYDAGILDSELSLAAITATIPYLTLTAGSGTYRSIIEQILAETGYSARVSAAGVVSLYDLGPSTITPALTLSSGASGNLADGYTVERKEATAEAVDVEYNSTKTLTAVMLYEDATGASAGLDASISVPAGTYYPVGAALGVSVKAAMEIEDYDIIAASSVTSDILYNGVLSIQEFVQSGKYILLRLYSASGAVITRLRGTGTAVVKGDLVRVVRENVAGTLKRDTVEFKYLADTPSAQRIARIRAARHLYGAFRWTLTTTELTLTPGDYVTLSEAVVLGASSTLRVVSVVDGPDPKTITIEAEGVVAYTATATTTSNETVQPPAQGPSAQAAETALKDSIALASTTLALSTAAAIRSRAGAVSPGTLTVSARTSLGDAYAGRIAIAVSSDGATYDDEMGIPSDPAGVTYLQDAWADTDGWLVFVGDGTEAVGGGVYTLTPNGTLTYIRTRKALDPTGTTERLRFKKNGQVTAAYYYNGTTYVAMTLIDDGDYYIATAYITTGYSYAYIRFSGPATLTLPIEIDWVYYGTGAYAGYLSASDESSKDYTIPATMLANGILSYVASIRVRLYAAGGTTNLLGERLCSVSADPVSAPVYLGPLASAPSSECIAGDYYWDNNTVGTGTAGTPRIYSGSAWTEYLSSMAGYQNAMVTMLADMGAWATAQGSVVAAASAIFQKLVTADAFIANLFTQSITVGTGGRIRYETGSGVQKRTVQLADEKIDWLDTPDTSPASPELLRARIGRLGVGGAILMDGDFEAPITSTYSARSLVLDEIMSYLSLAKTINDGMVCVLQDSAYNLYEITKPSGGSWSAKANITNTANWPSIIQLSDGSYICTFKSTIDSKLYQVTKPVGGSWSARTLILNEVINLNGNVMQDRDGTLHSVFRLEGDYQVYEITKPDGGTWTTIKTNVYNGQGLYPYIAQDSDGAFHCVFAGSGATPYAFVSTRTGSSWGARVQLNSASCGYTMLAEDISRTLHCIYRDSATRVLYETNKPYGGTWTTPVVISNEQGYMSSMSQDSSGSFHILLVYWGDGKPYQIALQRYARIGAGIIESGSNTNGSWIKYGDGVRQFVEQ